MSIGRHSHYDELDDDEETDSVLKLRSKVKILKNVSIQIGEETREHNKFLSRLDDTADSVSSLLSFNTDYVKRLARAGHNNIVFYLLAFALFVMVVIYLINKSL